MLSLDLVTTADTTGVVEEEEVNGSRLGLGLVLAVIALVVDGSSTRDYGSG